MTLRFVRMGAAALVVALALAPAAGAQTVTANVRGRVMSGGSPVASATVTAKNSETGFSRSTLTDEQGRYLILGLPPGVYAVRAQAIGQQAQEKQGYQLAVAAEVIIDFALQASAVEVSAVTVTAEQTPLVDPTRTGVTHRVDEAQIEGLPTNGRNFTDFIGLAPTYVRRPSFGAGAQGGSLGGARDGGLLIQMDGVQNTGTFFGGDPRGSDRLPIAFSIEAVKEFQVITNEYDVSKGGFTGGVVNAVTKSGTNEFHGSFFEYFRSEGLTYDNFLGIAPTAFSSHQFGGHVSGPVIRDKLHFFFALDLQVRDAPITTIATETTGLPQATLDRLDSIITNVYGVDPGASGTFTTQQNEFVAFGRIDWNISSRHRLSIRDSYTNLDLTGDRLANTNPYDYGSNGGPLKPKANSFAVNLFSNLSSSLFNEVRFQVASDLKPRPPEVTYPQMRVVLSGRTIALGADSIIHFNNLEERTVQFADIVSYTRGAHAFQAGVDYTHYDFLNLFLRNGLGTYTFNWANDQATLDSLAAQHASTFTRLLPYSGVSPVQNPDSITVAEYTASNTALFLQDRWQVSSRLTVSAGIRLDLHQVSGIPKNNPLLLDSFPQFFLDSAGIDRLRGGTATAADSITTGREAPNQSNFAPRLGFAYDVWGDRRTVIRGGAGLFYGYTPYVFWSNMFLGTGRDFQSVVCSGATAATQGVDLTVEAPVNCGAPAAAIADALFFADNYSTPRVVKSNLGLDHGVTRNFVIGGEFAYARTYDNYSVRDVNFRTTNPRYLRGEGGRIVVGNAPGSSGSSVRRIDPRFGQVLIHENASEAEYWAMIASMRYRTGPWDVSGSYTYSRNRDDYSRSCCISQSQWTATEAGLNLPSDLAGNYGISENDIPHTLVLSGLWRGPAGIQISGIWRTTSGRPYSPFAGSSTTPDLNGDGIAGTDLAYIPRGRSDITIDGNGGSAGVGTAAQQDSAYAVLNGLINGNKCLATQRGRIAERNSCRNPSRSVLDMKLLWRTPLFGGQSLEITADFFNVLNGLNPSWGRWTSDRTRLMRVRGFDAVNDRYVYEVDSTFGQKQLEFGGALAQFQMQLGARYRF